MGYYECSSVSQKRLVFLDATYLYQHDTKRTPSQIQNMTEGEGKQEGPKPCYYKHKHRYKISTENNFTRRKKICAVSLLDNGNMSQWGKKSADPTAEKCWICINWKDLK